MRKARFTGKMYQSFQPGNIVTVTDVKNTPLTTHYKVVGYVQGEYQEHWVNQSMIEFI